MKGRGIAKGGDFSICGQPQDDVIGIQNLEGLYRHSELLSQRVMFAGCRHSLSVVSCGILAVWPGS